jgi:hypothetical protein
MRNCFRGSSMDEMVGSGNLKHTYCYSFVEVGSVKEKRMNMKVMYTQVGVSLAHKSVKPSRSSHVLPDKQVDRH